MQKKKIKLILIISNIFLIITLILALLMKTKIMYNLYWIIIPIIMLTLMMLLKFYDKQGKNFDNESSKHIIANYNDSTIIASVFYYLPYSMLLLYEYTDKNILKNNYIIICFFIMTCLYEFTLIYAINNANEETAKLIENKYNKK